MAGYNGSVFSLGAWRSPVARIVRDDEVPGSNPGAPTIHLLPTLRSSCFDAKGRHPMDELYYQSAVSMVEALRRREISSRELTEAHLARIEEVNPAINAVVLLDAEGALATADERDRESAKDESRGPLHGLPITIKDSLETAGMVTVAGTQGRAGVVPEYDATVVARLKEAGAVLMGKSNTPELTMTWESSNFVYGRTNNPYDLSRSPSGSSGGAGAIVAAGGSSLDMGTDSAGSIRMPAHYCGIAGLKPTQGRVSRAGHVPPHGMGATGPLNQVGPMARFVEDLWLALPVISGVDGRDPALVPMPLSGPESVDLSGLRCVYFTAIGDVVPDPATVKAVEDAAQVLRESGAEVREGEVPGMARISALCDRVSAADGYAWLRRQLEKAGTKKVDPVLVLRMTRAKPIPSAELMDILEQLDRIRGEMVAFMEGCDLVLSPTGSAAALPHGEANQDDYPDAIYTRPYNLTGWPGCVVRAGTSPEGLPIGVQLGAISWREDIVLAAATAVESVLGGWKPSTLLP